MANERNMETIVGERVLFDLATLCSAIEVRYGDTDDSRGFDPEADDIDGLESDLFDIVRKGRRNSESTGFNEQSLIDLADHARQFTNAALRYFTLSERTDVGLSLIHLIGDCVEGGIPFQIENYAEVLKEVSERIRRDLTTGDGEGVGDPGADGRRILFTNEERTRSVLKSIDAAVEACLPKKKMALRA